MSFGLGGQVQEQLALAGVDLEPAREGVEASRLGGESTAGIVKTEVNKGAAFFVEADA